MKIHFDKVIPRPLEDSLEKDSIWNSDFTLQKGEKGCLNAQSGKGKTTFTSILAGIRKDYRGTIYFDHKDIQSFTREEWTKIRREKMSYVFQDLQLFPKLTVGENIQLKNELTQTFQEEELKKMTERLDIKEKWASTCGELSLGQQQRVAIIRALCQPFDWLILDEPFSHLDKENMQKALSLISEQVESQQSGMLITSLGNLHSFKFDRILNL